jgi:hypothetical protein
MYRRDAVVVMPVDFGKRQVYMIDQPRYLRAFSENEQGRKAISSNPKSDNATFTIGKEELMTLEFPAGVIDEGEEPSKAALRELREETGIILPEDRLEKVAGYYPSIGGSTEFITAYIARMDETTEIEQPVGDGHELIRVWRMTFDEAFDRLKDGAIRTASSNVLMRELMLRSSNDR